MDSDRRVAVTMTSSSSEPFASESAGWALCATASEAQSEVRAPVRTACAKRYEAISIPLFLNRPCRSREIRLSFFEFQRSLKLCQTLNVVKQAAMLQT